MSGGKSRGCLFCRTGKEQVVVQQFQKSFPGGKAIAPTKSRYRRTKDDAIEERETLLPGYVFFEVDDSDAQKEQGSQFPVGEGAVDYLEHELRVFSRSDDVLRLLKYTNGDWRLHGADDMFAGMIFKTDGNIGLSRAYFDEGDRIRISSGFLKDYEGSIARVNRKTRAVEVSVDFHEKNVRIWLGYELINNRTDGTGE